MKPAPQSAEPGAPLCRKCKKPRLTIRRALLATPARRKLLIATLREYRVSLNDASAALDRKLKRKAVAQIRILSAPGPLDREAFNATHLWAGSELPQIRDYFTESYQFSALCFCERALRIARHWQESADPEAWRLMMEKTARANAEWALLTPEQRKASTDAWVERDREKELARKAKLAARKAVLEQARAAREPAAR